MRLSSSFVAPAAVALLSAALLCGEPGTALSQTRLPGVTVDAPKPAARPHRPVAAPNTVASRRTTAASRPTAATAPTSPAARAPSAPPDSVLGKLAKLEKASSSCADGCETSLKTATAPWHGCSYSGGVNANFSTTCTDTLKYKS